jgi:FRG domain
MRGAGSAPQTTGAGRYLHDRPESLWRLQHRREHGREEHEIADQNHRDGAQQPLQQVASAHDPTTKTHVTIISASSGQRPALKPKAGPQCRAGRKPAACAMKSNHVLTAEAADKHQIDRGSDEGVCRVCTSTRVRTGISHPWSPTEGDGRGGLRPSVGSHVRACAGRPRPHRRPPRPRGPITILTAEMTAAILQRRSMIDVAKPSRQDSVSLASIRSMPLRSAKRTAKTRRWSWDPNHLLTPMPPCLACSLACLAVPGVPTRLLDWSRSPTKAAYFAACEAAK